MLGGFRVEVRDSDRSRTIDNQRTVAGESPRRLPARRARGNRSGRWPGV